MLVDLIIKAINAPAERSLYTGIRKIVRGLHHSVEKLPEVDMEQLLYKRYESKMKQLLRNYHNPNEIAHARTKLAVRRDSPHTSVAVATLGDAKDSRSQGFCLREIIITQTPKWTEVDVVWRSTELIQKNTADYALIPEILKELELAHEPRRYNLYMANGYVTALFMPILFQHIDGVEFFEILRKADPKYFRTALNAFAKFLEPTCRYNYRHRQKAYASAQANLEIEPLIDYCKLHGASFNV
jgi:hypothetical protein